MNRIERAMEHLKKDRQRKSALAGKGRYEQIVAAQDYLKKKMKIGGQDR